MPSQKIDFQTAFIYKIECRDPTIVQKYYGSTCGIEAKRKNCHKSNCNNPNSKIYNQSVYQFIRNNGGWKNWIFIKIKEFPCANRTELNIEEQKYILADTNALNKNRAFRTEEERFADANIISKKRSQIKIICECGSKSSAKHISDHLKTSKHKNYLSKLNHIDVNSMSPLPTITNDN